MKSIHVQASYFNIRTQPVWIIIIIIIIIIITTTITYLLTAVVFSFGGSSPYTSTDTTNKNKYT